MVRFLPDRLREMLLTFRRIRKQEGAAPVIVLDVALFPDDTAWAYVADSVNRSGSNPLVGLGPLLTVPFPDLSRLYHVPAGHEGVTAVSLGTGFPPDPALPPGVTVGRILCGYLQHAAILAHVEGLPVTGVLVAEDQVPGFDLPELQPGGNIT